MTSLRRLITIGNVEDFADDKKLAAYLGIVPRISISNETSHYGRITKMGNKKSENGLGAINSYRDKV